MKFLADVLTDEEFLFIAFLVVLILSGSVVGCYGIYRHYGAIEENIKAGNCQVIIGSVWQWQKCKTADDNSR